MFGNVREQDSLDNLLSDPVRNLVQSDPFLLFLSLRPQQLDSLLEVFLHLQLRLCGVQHLHLMLLSTNQSLHALLELVELHIAALARLRVLLAPGGLLLRACRGIAQLVDCFQLLLPFLFLVDHPLFLALALLVADRLPSPFDLILKPLPLMHSVLHSLLLPHLCSLCFCHGILYLVVSLNSHFVILHEDLLEVFLQEDGNLFLGENF